MSVRVQLRFPQTHPEVRLLPQQDPTPRRPARFSDNSPLLVRPIYLYL